MWRASLLVLAACGRLGFDAGQPGDAAGGDGATDGFRMPPALVQTVSGEISNATQLVISLPMPTRTGDLLVVTSGGMGGGPAEALGAVADDAGNAYRSANAIATWNGASDLVEIWYAPNSRPGATTVTLVGTQLQDRESWFLEVSGLDPVAPLDTIATTNNGPTTTTPTAPPVVVASGSSLVVGVTDVTNNVTGLVVGSPFVSLATHFGNNTAYTFAQTPGTYSAVWNDPTAGSYCAASAVFKP